MPAPVSSLIPTALSLREAQNRPADHGDRVRVAVWDVLSTIDDPRGRRGRRHELATVLVVSLAAVLAGATTLSAIAGWAGDQPRWTLRGIGVTRAPPSLSRIRRVLLAVDADVLDAVLHAWLAALAPPAQVPAPFRAVAVDGRTCRGARGRKKPGCTCSPSSTTPTASPWVRPNHPRKDSRSPLSQRC